MEPNHHGGISDTFEEKLVGFYCIPLCQGGAVGGVLLEKWQPPSPFVMSRLWRLDCLPPLDHVPSLLSPQWTFPSCSQTLFSRKSTEIQACVEGNFEGAPGGHQGPQSHMQMHLGARVIVKYSLMKVDASLGNARRLGIRKLSFGIEFNCLFFCSVECIRGVSGITVLGSPKNSQTVDLRLWKLSFWQQGW